MAILPCPCKGITIRGKRTAIKRGLATGPLAEQAAIDDALKQAEREADKMMTQYKCVAPCVLTWKPKKVRIRSSGSQNNPAFPIIGEAVAIWEIFPVCSKPGRPGAGQPVGKPKKKSGKSTPLTPPTPGANPYPVTKIIPCGTIKIFIAHGVKDVKRDGAIVFDFKMKSSELCDCDQFGWIQHVKRSNSKWRYDNFTKTASMHGGMGALSDPSQSVQPTQPPPGTGFEDWEDNPWYGVYSGAKQPLNFDQHPKPQTRIGDKPSDRNTSFVTQLVCVETGEVFFSWYWGPVPDESTPLEDVPAGSTPPP